MISSAPISTADETVRSSLLTARCLREHQLKGEGKAEPIAATALYRGALVDAALCNLHFLGLSQEGVIKSVHKAQADVALKFQEEGRPLSEAVDKYAIAAEVSKIIAYYETRLGDSYRACTLIGCQIPVTFTMMVDKKPFRFQSHIDLMVKHPDGSLCVDDWKWRTEQPTHEYLARNQQFAAYAYGVRYGLANGVKWNHWPLLRWIDLARLKPYARNGPSYKAGEHRPLENIIRNVVYDDSSKAPIEAMLTERVRMVRAGFFPQAPSPIDCICCASRKWCPQFSANESLHQVKCVI